MIARLSRLPDRGSHSCCSKQSKFKAKQSQAKQAEQTKQHRETKHWKAKHWKVSHVSVNYDHRSSANRSKTKQRLHSTATKLSQVEALQGTVRRGRGPVQARPQFVLHVMVFCLSTLHTESDNHYMRVQRLCFVCQWLAKWAIWFHGLFATHRYS